MQAKKTRVDDEWHASAFAAVRCSVAASSGCVHQGIPGCDVHSGMTTSIQLLKQGWPANISGHATDCEKPPRSCLVDISVTLPRWTVIACRQLPQKSSRKARWQPPITSLQQEKLRTHSLVIWSQLLLPGSRCAHQSLPRPTKWWQGLHHLARTKVFSRMAQQMSRKRYQ